MQVNRTTSTDVRAAVEAGLNKLGEELGISLTLGHRGMIDGNSLEWKLVAAQIGEDGTAETPELMALKRYRPDLVGAVIRGGNGAGPLNVTGYNPRAPKWPILAKCQNGKGYKVPIRGIEGRVIEQTATEDPYGIPAAKPVEGRTGYGDFA